VVLGGGWPCTSASGLLIDLANSQRCSYTFRRMHFAGHKAQFAAVGHFVPPRFDSLSPCLAVCALAASYCVLACKH
jgi:hypothetical protein